MDPPPCVQNAMMTKDKKPFTYTPGGIDLSQVRSPRMQRRIERNATLGGDNEVPRPAPPPPQNHGPLPPSALAAMRPQTQVQVFPGPPPPPPMQKNIPPPPPPPSAPLPTQKVTTGENQVIERPDMTKIIPDNPMTLLRKTGGPAPRKCFVDQMYESQSPPSPPQRSFEAQSPMCQPPERPSSVQPQQYQPQQQQVPQGQYQPAYQQSQPQYQQQKLESPRSPGYTSPTTPPTQKNVASNVGSLYIPPISQQQQKVASPPTPPERNQPQVQSPGTPTLKEAPRPWQQKNVQQEIPPWAKKDDTENQSPPIAVPNMQHRWQPAQVQPQPQQQQFAPRSPQTQMPSKPQAQTPPTSQGYPSNSFPVHIEIRTNVPYQGDLEPTEPNAVYVTQPVVLQHPGPGFEPLKVQPKQPAQQQQPNQYQPQPRQQVQPVQSPKVDTSSGTRIIPIQIERTPPSTPGGERNLNRQMSWGNQPTQSNAFKVIQKFTNTEEDEEDDTPVTHHSARYPQEMPEQVRRMKINDNNGQFRQVPQQNNAGRTIPVQAEGNGHPSQQQKYVHPSEQVVPEPKKYMGSNIPSRSFKILQAMTAPSDNCANANNNDDEPKSNNPTYFPPFAYPPPHPYPPAYWHDYYYANYFPKEQSESCRSLYWEELSESTSKMSDRSSKSGRSTPICPPMPYWMSPSDQFNESTSKMSDRSSRSGRSTPMPYWMPPLEQFNESTSKLSDKSGRSTPICPPMPYWMPPPPPYMRARSTTPTNSRPQSDSDDQHLPTRYPPYFDPYYFSCYYYGYPPVMMPPPHSHYPSSADNDEQSGYSSTDEMCNYNQKRRNSLENGSKRVEEQFEVRSQSATPRITVTQEDDKFNVPPDKLGGLKSIKSVQNIHVYRDETSSEEEEYETSEDEEETSEEEDIIPHQLSVIYEESERGGSKRCNSVCSESTTVTEHYSEEEDFLASQTVKYKIGMFQETSEMLSAQAGNTFRSFREECRVEEAVASSDRVNEKAETVMVQVEDEVVCVKLRNKVPSSAKSCGQVPEEAPRDGGTLMKIDSFVRQFQDIKRNSGLWSLEDEYVCKANVISEESSGESEAEERQEVESLVSSRNNREESCLACKKDEISEHEPLALSINNEVDNSESEDEECNKDEEINVRSVLNEEALESFNNIEETEDETEEEETLTTIANDSNVEYKPEQEETLNLSTNTSESTISKEIIEESAIAQTPTNTVEDESSAESEVDFWSQIKTDDDDFTPRRRSYYRRDEDEPDEPVADSASSCERAVDTSHAAEEAPDTTSTTCYDKDMRHDEENDNCSPNDDSDEEETPVAHCTPVHVENEDEYEEEESESDSSDSSEEETPIQPELERPPNDDQERPSRSKSLEPQTIKERIEALQNCITRRQSKVSEKETLLSVKSKVPSFDASHSESLSKTTSTKSSMKSFEEYSEEEEPDSGVISDISRHISDNEEFPELRKMTRYERAATHSRLFKLLQEECDMETKEDKFSKLSVRKNRDSNQPLSPRRSQLSLPLVNKCGDATTDRSIINEKLVEELVQSLLRSKKAQMFRNMPKEKLYSAAVRILQEGVTSSDTPSEDFSSLLSPLRGDTENSSPAQTPQEFYTESDYRQYYDSWSDAAVEIVPSKAFKLLQDHLGANKVGAIEGLFAKCPRILSSKNLLKTLEESGDSDCSSPLLSYPLPEANEVTKT